MKMLGFMIALTVFYWLMSSYAQTVIAGTAAGEAPCEAHADASIIEHSRVADSLNQHQAADQSGIRFEISPADAKANRSRIAGLQTGSELPACSG